MDSASRVARVRQASAALLGASEVGALHIDRERAERRCRRYGCSRPFWRTSAIGKPRSGEAANAPPRSRPVPAPVGPRRSRDALWYDPATRRAPRRPRRHGSRWVANGARYPTDAMITRYDILWRKPVVPSLEGMRRGMQTPPACVILVLTVSTFPGFQVVTRGGMKRCGDGRDGE